MRCRGPEVHKIYQFKPGQTLKNTKVSWAAISVRTTFFLFYSFIASVFFRGIGEEFSRGRAGEHISKVRRLREGEWEGRSSRGARGQEARCASASHLRHVEKLERHGSSIKIFYFLFDRVPRVFQHLKRRSLLIAKTRPCSIIVEYTKAQKRGASVSEEEGGVREDKNNEGAGGAKRVKSRRGGETSERAAAL